MREYGPASGHPVHPGTDLPGQAVGSPAEAASQQTQRATGHCPSQVTASGRRTRGEADAPGMESKVTASR